ncbi:hypothetical protein GURASL_12110 [Geotalea uraniireducens]|uniref:Uncharacterized protein n=1 Tax=Geotalea uraniireducens TaxID=351604 RepID=A0ABM8EIN2_9BACT|nr:hypothetical protein [Geotalea uraniireducens]BDV42288.1 hypothetical protein GURASL_12110 [Geotalea uraniireducens]
MLKDMKSYCHLKPGQKGTQRLVEQYGDALLCVRYRCDAKRGVRLKTVELIVEERPARRSCRFGDGLPHAGKRSGQAVATDGGLERNGKS